MASDTAEVECYLYRFLVGELPLEEFEQWVYATPQIEDYLGKIAYNELISFNFQQPHALHELTKSILEFVGKNKFREWQIKELLNILLDETKEPQEIYQAFDTLDTMTYYNEYWFLYNITSNFYNYKSNDNIKIRARELKNEIELILQGLESGEIMLLDEKEYQISPGLEQKLIKLRLAGKEMMNPI